MTATREHPETEIQPPRPRRARRRWRSSLFIAVLVIAGFAATGVLPVREYLERGDRVAAAQLELDQVTAENEALSESIDALLTEEGVERLAREQYGFVRPGEIGFVAVPMDGADTDAEPTKPGDPVEVVPERTEADERSFFQGVWDFVTGRDRVHDG